MNILRIYLHELDFEYIPPLNFESSHAEILLQIKLLPGNAAYSETRQTSITKKHLKNYGSDVGHRAELAVTFCTIV